MYDIFCNTLLRQSYELIFFGQTNSHLFIMYSTKFLSFLNNFFSPKDGFKLCSLTYGHHVNVKLQKKKKYIKTRNMKIDIL